MNLQPEVGTTYYVCLPGQEECHSYVVVELTERTVVLIQTWLYKNLRWSESYHDKIYAEGSLKRYPRSSIRFVEEAPQ